MYNTYSLNSLPLFAQQILQQPSVRQAFIQKLEVQFRGCHVSITNNTLSIISYTDQTALEVAYTESKNRGSTHPPVVTSFDQETSSRIHPNSNRHENRNTSQSEQASGLSFASSNIANANEVTNTIDENEITSAIDKIVSQLIIEFGIDRDESLLNIDTKENDTKDKFLQGLQQNQHADSISEKNKQLSQRSDLTNHNYNKIHQSLDRRIQDQFFQDQHRHRALA